MNTDLLYAQLKFQFSAMQKEVFCRGLFFRLLTQVLNIAALRNIRMSIFPLEIDFKHAITQ